MIECDDMKNENTPWLLRYWWLPVTVTLMCCLYSAIGDYYTRHHYAADYMTDWGPFTQIVAFIGLIALIWRVVNLIVAIAYKKWAITVILILFHFVAFALFFVVDLMFYPYSEL